MTDQALTLSRLTTGYNHRPVTKDINAALCAGQLACLLGPNGAGKSTLLKTLCGLIPPLSGKISVFGKALGSMSANSMARCIGVVLTERPSTINMTVEELVAIGRSPYTSFMGRIRPVDREIVEQAICRTGIEDLRYRYVSTLSDGERQKTLIAKTLAQQTPIIFLDEPTAFLDYPSKVELMRLLSQLAADEGKTVFMSTHDIDIAIKMADSLWLLDKSHGLTIGTPSSLAADGSIAAYFDTPSLRFDPSSLSFAITK